MTFHRFNGEPKQIGIEYGKALAPKILHNLKLLVSGQRPEALPRADAGFKNWVRRQEQLIAAAWPWLLEEMHGVAQGAAVNYEDILLLNLRAWQYTSYGAEPSGGCSSLAITLADGTVAGAGALDDPAVHYSGPVKVVPDHGYPFITFPIAGTSWGNRGMNSQGLSVGISSQLLPGLRRLPHAVNQDLAVRVILQTCRTAQEVREFCRKYPFTMNLVVVDARGKIFCAQHTAAGLFEMPAERYCALTNHVADDQLRSWLVERGVSEFPESPTTRPRLENLLAFARANTARCTATEVRDFIAKRDQANPGSIHNPDTIFLTFANPQTDPETFWVLSPNDIENNKEFQPLKVT
jgi:predicted choloylglycine hydrolase